MKKTFNDSNEALLNPGMGFTHYEYSNQPETYGARLGYADTVDAPLYEDAFPALILKDADGGIAAVFVDETMNLRRVLPACLGGSSPARDEQSTVVHPAAPPEYDIYALIFIYQDDKYTLIFINRLLFS